MNLRPLDPQSSTLNQAELRPDRIEFRHDTDASAGRRWAVVCFTARAISGGRATVPPGRSAPQRRNARGVAEDVARTAKLTPGKRLTASAPAAPRRSMQTKLPSRSFLRSDAARRGTLRPAASTTCIRLPHRQTRHKRRRPLAEPVGNVGLRVSVRPVQPHSPLFIARILGVIPEHGRSNPECIRRWGQVFMPLRSIVCTSSRCRTSTVRYGRLFRRKSRALTRRPPPSD